MTIGRGLATFLVASFFLAACDQQGRPLEHWGIERLQAGVSTEADVRSVFGEPDAVVQEGDGSRIYQYPQGPQGTRTFFAVIGADGKLVRVWNVLVPATFAKILPGMTSHDVLRLLGRPGGQQYYALKRQTAWEWRIVEDNSTKLFVVMFDDAGRVVSTGIEDPTLSSGS